MLCRISVPGSPCRQRWDNFEACHDRRRYLVGTCNEHLFGKSRVAELSQPSPASPGTPASQDMVPPESMAKFGFATLCFGRRLTPPALSDVADANLAALSKVWRGFGTPPHSAPSHETMRPVPVLVHMRAFDVRRSMVARLYTPGGGAHPLCSLLRIRGRGTGVLDQCSRTTGPFWLVALLGSRTCRLKLLRIPMRCGRGRRPHHNSKRCPTFAVQCRPPGTRAPPNWKALACRCAPSPRPAARPTFCQTEAKFDHNWSNLAEFRSIWAKLWPNSTNLGRQTLPESANFSRIWADARLLERPSDNLRARHRSGNTSLRSWCFSDPP